MDHIRYAWHHRAEIAAWFIAGATAYSIFVATPLARVIKRPSPADAWWQRLLWDLAIDTPAWLAALERSGVLGGIFNVPGVPSRKAEDNPTPAASRMMRIRRQSDRSGMVDLRLILPVVFALALSGGCGTSGAQALGRCEMNTLPQQLEGLLARVVAAAFSSGTDWTATLEHAGKDAAPGQVSCLVQAVAGWLEDLTTGRKGQIDESYVEAHRRMRAYLDTHPPSAACGDLRRAMNELRDPDTMLFGGGGASARF
jgi:hypothetical protein